MNNLLTICPLVLVLAVGVVAGYFLGWRNGHLSGVEYTIDLMDGAADDVVAQYTEENLPQHIKERMGRIRSAYGDGRKTVKQETMEEIEKARANGTS